MHDSFSHIRSIKSSVRYFSKVYSSRERQLPSCNVMQQQQQPTDAQTQTQIKRARSVELAPLFVVVVVCENIGVVQQMHTNTGLFAFHSLFAQLESLYSALLPTIFVVILLLLVNITHSYQNIVFILSIWRCCPPCTAVFESFRFIYF